MTTNYANTTSNHTQCVGVTITTANVIYTLFMVIVMVTSLTGNLLVTVSIFISPVLKERSHAVFIASLACSDFIFAALLIPFRLSSILYDGQFCFSLALCYLYMVTDAFCNTASITTLLIIAIDRYIAITWPFRYHEIVTIPVARKTILLTWTVAALWSFIGMFNWHHETNDMWSIKIGNTCHNKNLNYFLASFLGFYLSSLTAMTVIYLKILHVALRHAKAIALTETFSTEGENCIEDEDVRGNHANCRRRKKELKSTKTLAMVYGAFVICFLPSSIISIILFFASGSKLFSNLKENHPAAFLFIYYAFVEVLPILNTAVNPFIYSFSNTQFRDAFKRVYRKVMQKHFDESYFDQSRKRPISLIRQGR